MTKDEVDVIMKRVFEECHALRGCGQKEYAGGEDAFGNFERLSSELGIPREKILWVYAMKHKDGIASWIRGHKSQRESVTGRINDLIVYLVLLRSMVEDAVHPLLDPKADGLADHLASAHKSDTKKISIEVDLEKHRAEVCKGCGCCSAIVAGIIP